MDEDEDKSDKSNNDSENSQSDSAADNTKNKFYDEDGQFQWNDDFQSSSEDSGDKISEGE